MRLKSIIYALLLVSSLALCQSSAALEAAERPRSSYDPAASSAPCNQTKSGLEAAIEKINPQNKDYGRVIDQVRVAAVEQTIEDFYWWSCLALCLILMLGCMYVVWLLRERKTRLCISADIVTQLYNSHFAARAKAIEAIEMHNRLARRFNAQSIELTAAREACASRESMTTAKDGLEAAEKLRSRRPSKSVVDPGADNSPALVDNGASQSEVQKASAEDEGSEGVAQLQERVRQLTAQNKAGEQKIANLRTQLGRAHHSLEGLRENAPTGRQA
jgi:hypothetical protein